MRRMWEIVHWMIYGIMNTVKEVRDKWTLVVPVVVMLNCVTIGMSLSGMFPFFPVFYVPIQNTSFILVFIRIFLEYIQNISCISLIFPVYLCLLFQICYPVLSLPICIQMRLVLLKVTK